MNELFFKKSQLLLENKEITYKTSLVLSDVSKNRPDPKIVLKICEAIIDDVEAGSDWYF